MENITTEPGLIEVRQLPIIVEQLRKVKGEIEAEAERLLALPCTEDTVKTIKEARTAFRARFEEFEARRIAVKKAVLAPFDVFLKVYEECVSLPFGDTDAKLKAGIEKVENGIKDERRAEVQAYLDELCAVEGIDFLTLDKIGVRIGLSVTVVAVKKTIKATVEDVVANLALIDTLEFPDEIRAEFRTSLNVSQAAATVRARHAAIEAEKERRERVQRSASANDDQMREIDKIIAESEAAPEREPQPAEPAEPLFRVTFAVTGSIDQIKALKQFLTAGGYNYEQLN